MSNNWTTRVTPNQISVPFVTGSTLVSGSVFSGSSATITTINTTNVYSTNLTGSGTLSGSVVRGSTVSGSTILAYTYLSGSRISGSISGSIEGNARVAVRQNSGGTGYQRRRINLVEGTGVTLTVGDDSANEEVDVTIASSASAGEGVGNYIIYTGSGPTYIARNLNTGVDDYNGAVGATCFQTAINNLGSTGIGGRIDIKAGVYNVATTIAIDENIMFSGVGFGLTVIRATSALDAVVEITQSGSIRDLTIDGNNTAVDGLEVKAANCQVTRVEVKDCTQDGIVLGDGATEYNGGRVDFCRISEADRYGINCTNNYNDVHILGNLVRGYINNDPSACLNLDGTGAFFVEENHFWGAHNCIRFGAGCDDGMIANNWIDDSYRHLIFVPVGGACRHATITGNKMRWPKTGYDAIAVSGSMYYVNITGNNIAGHNLSHVATGRYALSTTYASTENNITIDGNTIEGFAGSKPWVRISSSTHTVGYNEGLTEFFYETTTTWTAYTPSGCAFEGRKVTVYNSGAGQYRLYTYANAGWHYVTLT